MATLFEDNAHIHYHPLMFVYLIWLDYNLHKGIFIMHSSTIIYVRNPERVEAYWIKSKMHPVKIRDFHQG